MVKRVSVVLALVFLFSSLPIQVFADHSDPWQYERIADGLCITGYVGADTDLVIPDAIDGVPVVQIGQSAFRGGRYVNVTIPNSVTTIGKYAFRACINLKRVVLPEGLTNIDTGVFAYCSELSDVTIPQSVNVIGTKAFYFCESLREISLPDELTTLKNGVFSCSGLERVVIPDGVTELDRSVFEYCGNLTEITLGTKLCSVYGGQFSTCPNLRMVRVREGNRYYSSDEFGVVYNKTKTKVILATNGLTGHYVIPDGVIAIADQAFYGCKNLTGISIPNTLVTIGASAFQECSALQNVVVPDSVTQIGSGAFGFCCNMTDITIGAGVEYLDGEMLSGCDSLTEIRVAEGNRQYTGDEYGVLYNKKKTELIKAPGGLGGSYKVPDSVVTIAGEAFSGCMGLTYVTVPHGVTVLPERVFSECTGLTGISMPNSLQIIGAGAFTSCVSLTSISLPDSVTGIGSGAFVYCTGLEKIKFGHGITEIGDYAFVDCTGLTSVTIPNSVSRLGEGVFMGCTGLNNVTLGSGINVISDFLFCDCVSLKNVVFIGCITEIGSVAFSGTGIEYFTIAEGVTSIGDWAFYHTDALREISIPASVETIGDGVFSNSGLKKVYLNGDAVRLPEDTFNNVTASIYYPSGNPTWTDDIMGQYGGELTWLSSDGRFTLSGANVLLGSSLAMNFFIDKNDLSGSDYYAVITHYAQGEVYSYSIPYSQWDDRPGYMAVTLENLSAKQMADQIMVQIYHGDGTEASQPWFDSIRHYAARIFDQQNNRTKTLLVDMLNYGAAAQAYFTYNVDDPANSLLTEEQRGYGSEDASCTDQRVEGSCYYGSTLTLKNRIELTTYFENITTDMYAVIQYSGHYGHAKEYTVSGSDFVRYNSNTYGVVVNTLSVADGNQPVTVTVFDTNGNIVATATDSVNGYLSRMMGGNALFEAIARFTCSAYTYFHSA